MSDVVIKVEDLSKKYRLGVFGHGTLRQDLQSWWARMRGKEDPNTKLGVSTGGDYTGSSNKDFWALKDVSFEVKRGEVLGIIGRNGAGKSTLLKILSRVTTPTTGTAKIKGRVASLLEVGTGFHPELTGRENIYLNGAILGMTKKEIDKKFDEIVAFAEVEQFIDTPVKRYSSGMYVRLAFAVAAHLEPEILIVDEVLAVGDAQFQKKCLGKMKDVSQEGRTVLFVSHNMAAINNLCTSAFMLNGGQILFKGETQDSVNEYLRTLSVGTTQDNSFLAQNNDLLVTLKSFDFLNDKGQTVTSIQAGCPVTLRAVIESAVRYDSILMSMGINSIDDVRVCVFHTGLTGTQISVRPPNTDILCHIPKLPLAPGRYRISLKIMSGEQLLFWLPHAIEVSVESGDFYGTGRLPESWGGFCLIDHSWSANYREL